MAKPASGTSLDSGNSLFANQLAIWAMLEGSGTTSADSTGNGFGLSFSSVGDGNDPVWGTDGNGDPEIRCKGQAAGSTRKPLALASTLTDLGTVGDTADWSVAFRVKQTALGTQGMWMGQKGATNDYFWLAGHVPELLLNNNGGTTSIDNSFVDFTNYHDYLLTYTHGTGFKFYQDGTLSGASPFGAGAGFMHGINTLASAYDSSSDFSLTGAMSYVYVWNNRVLTGTDATNLHSNPYRIFQTTAAFLPQPPKVIGQAVKRASYY